MADLHMVQQSMYRRTDTAGMDAHLAVAGGLVLGFVAVNLIFFEQILLALFVVLVLAPMFRFFGKKLWRKDEYLIGIYYQYQLYNNKNLNKGGYWPSSAYPYAKPPGFPRL